MQQQQQLDFVRSYRRPAVLHGPESNKPCCIDDSSCRCLLFVQAMQLVQVIGRSDVGSGDQSEWQYWKQNKPT